MKPLLTLAVVLLLSAPAIAQAKPTRTLLIIPAANLKAGNEAAVIAFGKAGEGTFEVPYCSDKSGTVTHYVASLVISEKLKVKFDAAFEKLTADKVVSKYEAVTRVKLTELQMTVVNTKAKR